MSLSSEFSLPCVQDFRDGLVFESRGRAGFFSASARAILETLVVHSADLVTTVSMPIVQDFERRYPGKQVKLLPNGYDPADFDFLKSNQISPEAMAIVRTWPGEKVVIGHFGRVSESDSSRFEAFEYFIKSLNELTPPLIDRLHVLFVGTLTAREVAALDNLRCSKFTVASVRRGVALELMTYCDVQLLLTGNGTGCVTGKLFEYLAAGPSILCFSVVENEASRILGKMRCGRTILVGDDETASALLAQILTAPSFRSTTTCDAREFSKVTQARQLSGWIAQLRN
jgi:hypothetical protein